MADVDIDPFGEHKSRPEERTDENIPSDLATSWREGVQTWEPEREQETSFGGRSHTNILHKEYLVGKIYELIGNKMNQRLEPNLSLFVLGEDGRLYYKGKPLMEKQAELPSSSEIAGTDEIELEEIAKSTENLIFQINSQSQTDELFDHPLCELLGLDKQTHNHSRFSKS